MADQIARMETIREMLLHTQRIYSWCLDMDFRLQYSNCPSQEFFFNIFSVGACRKAAEDHFEDKRTPVILTDQLGFAWIATPQAEGGYISAIHMLGPVFTVEASEAYLRQLCSRLALSADLVSELLAQIKLVPTIPQVTALSYALMLHYCLTGNAIENAEVTLIGEISKPEEETNWFTSSWHGTWLAEQNLFNGIKEGNLRTHMEVIGQFATGRVGVMCPGNPLRQAKDEGIVLSVICSRAAIMGGVSPEGSFNLADYYIQRLEACETVTDTYNCGMEMYETYIRRVYQCKQHSKYSAAVKACMEYVETHIMEKISLDEMAQALGYTSYYLSGKFQKETGISVTNYIKQQKVETAKQMLEATSITSAEVSERLCFSSPSFFSATFKKFTGISPIDHQNRNIKE